MDRSIVDQYVLLFVVCVVYSINYTAVLVDGCQLPHGEKGEGKGCEQNKDNNARSAYGRDALNENGELLLSLAVNLDLAHVNKSFGTLLVVHLYFERTR